MMPGDLEAIAGGAPNSGATFTVRIFPEDETTEIVYKEVTHVFWEAGGTVLVLCLPDRHAHCLREWIRHYDIWKERPPSGGGYFGRHP